MSYSAIATHYRAGEIFYENISYLTYKVTAVTYTTDITGGPDRDTIEISWGDGTFSTALRINGPTGITGVPQGETVGNNIKKNIYTATHTYPGPLPFYVISVNDPNRVGNIINMTASVNVQFYVEDTLRIFDPTFVGTNSSPILLNPPIDYANVGDTFYHNPAAFDPDGDSLTFELVPPLRTQGVPVPGYQYPDQIAPGIDNVFTIDRFTGEIIWAVPQRVGIYNIAILVREYRGGVFLGSVLRDMQIFVDNRNNNPPKIELIKDTCIVAGSLLAVPVIASDPNPGQSVTVTAYGGPLELSVNPATFIGGTAASQITGLFEWQTVCDHVRRSSYQVVFKAEDNFTPPGQQPIPLSYLETWTIKVVAPAPENLTATAQGNNIILNWNNPYQCDTLATRKFIGFSVWRREGSNPFAIDTCTPGLAGRGYTKISPTQNIREFTFIDSTAAKGKNYCYRVLAEFAEQTSFGLFYNKVESLPSNEACSELKRDVPLIENVDVTETDAANGKIFVRWLKPIANAANLDTTQFPGPYRFELRRSEGFDLNNPISVATFNSNFFASYSDTTFTDSLLNTVDNPYTYVVDFYSNGGNVLVGSSEPASSVFLALGIGDKRMGLSWEANVPWRNDLYLIYRQDFNTGNFNLIDSTTATTYVDTGLVNDSTYCYYVRSKGAYTLSSLVNVKIYNNSQRVCAVPSDTAAPCPPSLVVLNDCNTITDKETCETGEEGFLNQLRWTPDESACDDDVEKYNVFYAAPGDSVYSIIETTSDTTFMHFLNNSLAGCYFITAIDSSGNESVPSERVCVDNCPCYILPNVFTPNGDGSNDVYTPILPYRFVERVEMKIYTRWGNLVFETTDPMINWDGKDQKTGKVVKEGVYFYVCKVFELRVDGVQESGDIRNGFIHVIRGK